MATFTEKVVTGKKYRICTDADNQAWDRISFWTAASDVEGLTNLASGTLTKGQTSLTITNPSIKADGLIDVYTTIYNVNPKTVTVGEGTITLTFKAQATDMGVRVRCL